MEDQELLFADLPQHDPSLTASEIDMLLRVKTGSGLVGWHRAGDARGSVIRRLARLGLVSISTRTFRDERRPWATYRTRADDPGRPVSDWFLKLREVETRRSVSI